MAWPLRDDLDLGVHHVWIGLYRKLEEAARAPEQQHSGRYQHNSALSQRELDYVIDHIAA
jgi:hypothetical protein